jgi:D-glycero-alpha-D-manno-heptose-7-phosphate kinase
MVITRTPYRISLFGGGSDYPQWYREHGGEVLSFTIDKYCYITTRILPAFFEHKYRVAYSKVETTNSIESIEHRAVRAALKLHCPDVGLEIHHDGDLPARSGIGSSSAFAVGLINSLSMLQNRIMTQTAIANAAIHLEQVELRENVGSQDQIACSIGGFNQIIFSKNESWTYQPIQIDSTMKAAIEDRLVLIYTGIQRQSSDVQATLVKNLNRKTEVMKRTIQLAREAREAISQSLDLDLIGEMLQESWYLKKEVNPDSVTPTLVDFWELARRSGAIGGKVLGAGGGGFCLFWVKEGQKEYFLSQFKVGLYVPVEISSGGTTCIWK